MAADQTYYTLQDIERYLNGSMTPQEMHELEKAALADPLLADAIDGFSKTDHALAARHLNEIAALINKPEAGHAVVAPMQRAKNNWWRWTAAAGIAGILGFSAWLLMRWDDQDAKTIAKADAEIVRADTNRSVAADNTKTEVADTNTLKITDIPVLANAPSAPFIARGNPATIAKDQGLPAAQEEAASLSDSQAAASTLGNEMVAELGSATEAAQLRNQAPQPMMRSKQATGTSDMKELAFSGIITDHNSKPLAGVSVVSGSLATVTNANGSFHLLVGERVDSLNIQISAIGFENEKATLFAGRTAGIALQPDQTGLDEVVVIGYGTKKKKAELGNFSQLKVEKLEQTEYPYPDGGWAHFYKELSEELGINETRANKLLHIRFYVEDGEPTDFTVVKTPDLALAEKAIAAIKKGPRWKNYQKRRNTEIRIKVE